jgi:hypothetical protein
MLGAHPEVVCPPEVPFIGPLASLLHGDRSDVSVKRIHRTIQSNYKFAFWDLSPADLEACSEVKVTSYREIIDEYVRRFAQQNDRPCPTFWVDHSPTTLMYSSRLSSEFPEAKFIHLIRDGRAVCASWIPLDWGPNTIVWAARTWAMHVGYALAAEASLSPTNVRRVTYESLVTTPEAVLNALCEWIGLSYHPAMLTSSGLRVPTYTRNQHRLVGGQADPKRIDSWRGKLTSREIELFEHITGDLLVHLGYELAGGGWSAGPGRLEMARFELTERASQLAHLATVHFRRMRFMAMLKGERKRRNT